MGERRRGSTPGGAGPCPSRDTDPGAGFPLPTSPPSGGGDLILPPSGGGADTPPDWGRRSDTPYERARSLISPPRHLSPCPPGSIPLPARRHLSPSPLAGRAGEGKR